MPQLSGPAGSQVRQEGQGRGVLPLAVSARQAGQRGNGGTQSSIVCAVGTQGHTVRVVVAVAEQAPKGSRASASGRGGRGVIEGVEVGVEGPARIAGAVVVLQLSDSAEEGGRHPRPPVQQYLSVIAGGSAPR